jgi:hypothetical protein
MMAEMESYGNNQSPNGFNTRMASSVCLARWTVDTCSVAFKVVGETSNNGRMKHQRQKTVEIYLDSPTPFMIEYWEKLLPDWKVLPQTIVLILLKSQLPLDGEGEIVELEKDRLLHRFWEFGQIFDTKSHQQGFFSEIISPKDGTPQYSKKGQLIFDLVATVHHALGFDFSQTEGAVKH